MLMPQVGVARELHGDTGESREEFKFRTVYPVMNYRSHIKYQNELAAAPVMSRGRHCGRSLFPFLQESFVFSKVVLVKSVL